MKRNKPYIDDCPDPVEKRREKKDRKFLKRIAAFIRATFQGYIGGMTLLAWWPWVLALVGAFLVAWRLMR